MDRKALAGSTVLFLVLALLTVRCSSTLQKAVNQPEASDWNVVQGFPENSVKKDITGATIGGGGRPGNANRVSADFGTVGGGAGNSATGNSTTVSGGLNNRATDHYGTISGGRGNLAGSGNGDPRDTPYATVGGGLDNIAGGPFSTVPGGAFNQAAAGYSFAAGHRARVQPDHPGTFLYADSQDVPFTSSAPDEFAVRASGGVRLVTAVDGQGVPIAGVTLAAGSGSWATLSDRTVKANVAPVDGREILNRLTGLAIFTWNYASQDASIRHIGPMAQDFYALYALGEDSKHINTVDTDGVALAAIQGLSQIVQEQKAQIQEQETQIEVLAERIATLEQETRQTQSLRPLIFVSNNWPLLVTVILLGLVLKKKWNN